MTTHTPEDLHVCSIKQSVQMGQTHGRLVFEAGKEPLLDRTELLCMAT